MSTWLKTIATDELLREWVMKCPALKFVCSPDGKILWANQAFLEWSQYRLSAVTRLTVTDLTGDGEAAADIGELETQSAVVQRMQFRPNGEADQWGYLTRMRYPMSSKIEYLLCTWEPIKSATAEAFNLAIQQIEKNNKGFGEMSETLHKGFGDMSTAINTLASRTEEENALLSLWRVCMKHPRTSLIVLCVFTSLLGFSALSNTIKTIIGIPTPVKVEKADYERLFSPDTQLDTFANSSSIDYSPPVVAYEVTAPGGITVSRSATGSTTVSWKSANRSGNDVMLFGSPGHDRFSGQAGSTGDGSAGKRNGNSGRADPFAGSHKPLDGLHGIAGAGDWDF